MFRTLFVLSALVIGSVSPAMANHGIDSGPPRGAVFVATNAFDQVDEALGVTEAVGNEIVMYHMAKDGSLSVHGRFPTGGQGAGPGTLFRGDALGSGNSVQLTENQRWLLATNAGSNELSVFHVDPKGLTLVDKVPSGGFFPNSVAIHKNLVYVLNSGDSSAFPSGFDGNITGFELDRRGHLTPLSGSTRGLAAGGNMATVECQTMAECTDREVPNALVNPTQVSFTPDGKFLVVTIKDGADTVPLNTGPGRILVFPLGENGLPSETPVMAGSNNRGPFAFSIDERSHLFVTEFLGGNVPPNGNVPAGAVISYAINRDGSLRVITPSINNDQVDSCWNAIAGGGRYLYTANFGSNTISSYTIDRDGSLKLLDATAARTSDGSANIDLAATRRGDFLYNVLPGVGAVAGWAVGRDGSLRSLGEFRGLEDTPDDPDGFPLIDPFGPGGSPAGIAIADFRHRLRRKH
jgi:6-phosphogluconolactonase (cycloisomerase 2 family)